MKAGLLLPHGLRREFSKPWGIVVSGDFAGLLPPRGLVTCIGDFVSSICLEDVPLDRLRIIIDWKTKRSRAALIDNGKLHVFTKITTENPPGMITFKALKTVCSAAKPKTAILVKGEEDLLALPAIACSRIGDTIIYGIPDRGAAIIRVTPEAKWHANIRILQLEPILARTKT